MRAITVESDSQVAIMTENTKSIRKSLFSQPAVKSFALADLFAVLRSAAVNMVNGEKFNPVLTAAGTFPAIAIYKGFALFSFLASHSGIRLLSVVSRPGVLGFKISPILFGVFFGISVPPSLVGFLIAFLAGYSQLVVSGRVFGEKFKRNTLLALIANSCSWNTASSIFGWPTVFLQDVLRFGICSKSFVSYGLYHSM